MSHRYLLLWFEAPLQSWGYDSKFCQRNTLDFPTKSGVLGMVCSALGLGGEQRELLAEFSKLSQTVLSFARTRNKSGQPLTKIKREPYLCDFHMVGGGYESKDPWAKMMIPRSADGKNHDAKVTYRNYLQDAKFAVILELPENRESQISEAMQFPAWPLFLGRKCCVPSDIIYNGLYPDQESAVNQAIEIAEEKKLMFDFGVIDGEHNGEVLTLRDVPVQFGDHKIYNDRVVTLLSSIETLKI